MAHLGVLFFDLGDVEAAKALLERALAIHQRTLGDRPYVARSLMRLGLVYQRVSDDHQARVYLQQALHMYESSLAVDHPYTKACSFLLAP